MTWWQFVCGDELLCDDLQLSLKVEDWIHWLKQNLHGSTILTQTTYNLEKTRPTPTYEQQQPNSYSCKRKKQTLLKTMARCDNDPDNCPECL